MGRSPEPDDPECSAIHARNLCEGALENCLDQPPGRQSPEGGNLVVGGDAGGATQAFGGGDSRELLGDVGHPEDDEGGDHSPAMQSDDGQEGAGYLVDDYPTRVGVIGREATG